MAVERQTVKSMSSVAGSRMKGLSREMLSVAPSLFHQMRKHKAEEAAIEWIELPTRAVKPSQTCHSCALREK